MAITPTTILRWPAPQSLDPTVADWSYDADIDMLELRFKREAAPRMEVWLDAPGSAMPMASVRTDEDGQLTGEVVGVMIQGFSRGFATHPEWRCIAEGHLTRERLEGLIETLAGLPPEPDQGLLR